MQKIGLFLCFFGEWPRWGDLFLESCRYNPTVDFFLLTDSKPSLLASDNVKLVEYDFPRLRNLVSERLGVDVEIPEPYKLIDVRPAWGVVFQDYLDGYDFWGYCDLDLVFGDIRAFLTDELLEAHDVIATRREFVTGHFTLFRNAEAINRLFQRSQDYRKVFTSATVFNFEECGWGLHTPLLKGASFAEIADQAEVDSLMHVLARSPEVRVYQETICEEQLGRRTGLAWDVLQIRWELGKVMDLLAKREVIYFHIHHLKESPLFYVPRWKKLPDAFLITRKGVFWLGREGLAQRLRTGIPRRLSSARALIRLNFQYFALQMNKLFRR